MIRFATFNVPSLVGKLAVVFDILAQYDVQVAAFQEVDINELIRARFREECRRHDFNVVFGGLGDRGITRTVLLCRLPIAPLVFETSCPERVAAGVVEVQDFDGVDWTYRKILVASVYGHANDGDARKKLCAEVLDFVTSSGSLWLALGDWNQEADDASFFPYVSQGRAQCLDL